MSDEPDVTAPGHGAPADDAADTPPGPEAAAPAPRRLGPMPWSQIRRRPRIAAITVCVVVAGAVAGIGLATMPGTPPGPQYASLPAQPCSMLRSADVARYLPGATGSPLSIPGSSQVRIGTCKWSAGVGGEDKTLLTQAVIFGSPSGIAEAQASYRSTLSSLKCRCPRVTASARPVVGLGDQAAEVFVAPRPDADFSSAPNASYPGTTLLIRSSNAIVFLGLDTTAPGTGASLAAPPGAAQLAALTSMARDVLSALARPAAIRPPAIASVTAQAHYAGRPDPCKMISSATLSKYAAGVILLPGLAPSAGPTQRSECSWTSDSISLTVTLNRYPGTADALRDFSADVASVGVTPTGARSIPDLGDAAAGTYTIDSGSDSVDLFVWSGNVYLDYSFKDTGSGPSRLDRAAPLAGVIAMARDGLTALARPALSSYGQGPRYASPHSACTMVKASTLARYVPGVTVDPDARTDSGGAPPHLTECGWGSGSVSITLIVTIDAAADDAQGQFESGVQFSMKDQGDTKYRGMRPVHGVGEQADAFFQILAGSPAVDLLVWSGNAEVDVSCSDVGFGPPLSRAGKLAADIAIARDVLASLPRG